MGGNASTTGKVSFGLDEDEKVTVLEGVKLSVDVLQRMREPGQPGTATPRQTDTHQPPTSSKPPGISTTEIQEEMHKNFERQQAMVQEQLARLAQKEGESAAAIDLGETAPALIIERGKAHEEQGKANILAKQLERKEKELAILSSFYKEQLETLEKKNLYNYEQEAEHYNQAATKAEARIRYRQTVSLCSELQAKVFQCYTENPQQSLHCSRLAKQYIACVQQAKSSLTNHS